MQDTVQVRSSQKSLSSLSKTERIRWILNSIDKDRYDELERRLVDAFGLHISYGNHHKFGIKAIIKAKDFAFIDNISLPSRVFMLTHTLGHYYFISRAHAMGIDKYGYIYDTFENTNLHVYEKSSIRKSPDEKIVTNKIRVDRTEFEVRANDFAVDLLSYLGYGDLGPLVKAYEAADINYILEVTEHGKDAIVQTDADYIIDYVTNDCKINEESNTEKIYRSNSESPRFPRRLFGLSQATTSVA